MFAVIDQLCIRGDWRKVFLFRHFGIHGNQILCKTIDHYKSLGVDVSGAKWEYIEADSGNVAFMYAKLNCADTDDSLIGLACTMAAIGSLLNNNMESFERRITNRLRDKYMNLDWFAKESIGESGAIKIYETMDLLV